MLSVFARKEYQSDVENISHIHIPGKIRQLYEQSRTELFDLISNNAVDIIKPEVVDDLIKEGIIEHKDDVIQVQLDGLTYLIHTCNSQFLVPDKDVKLIFRATNYRKSEDNTKHMLIDLPNNFSKPSIELLEKSGLATPIHNESNKKNLSKVTWIVFIQKNIFRLWKYGNDYISPFETRTFTA